MTSAFDSFNSSALGARIQSSVDTTGAFAGGVITTTTFADISLNNSIIIGNGTYTISCDGADFYDTYLIAAYPTPVTMRYHIITFWPTDTIPLYDSGVWTVGSTCGSSPAFRITGDSSGKVLDVPSRNFKVSGTGIRTTQQGVVPPERTPLAIGAQPDYVVPDFFELRVDSSGDVFSILYYIGAEDASNLPTELDFTNFETVTVELFT